jgi:hypothetical protein
MRKLTHHFLILLISLLALSFVGCTSAPSTEDVAPLVQEKYEALSDWCVVDNIEVSETVKKDNTTRVTATFDVIFLTSFEQIANEINAELQEMAKKDPFDAIARSAQAEVIFDTLSDKFGEFKKDEVQSHDEKFEMAQNQDGQWVQI